jgi:hypothetical protein
LKSCGCVPIGSIFFFGWLGLTPPLLPTVRDFDPGAPLSGGAAPLGLFDGKATAIVRDFVFTSPNQDVVCLLLPKGGMYLHADFRFGPHDHTLWPQPFIWEYSHLGAIPSKPMDLLDPLSIMWWIPTRRDFISSSGGAMDGIGCLSSARYSNFEEMRKELGKRITAHCQYNSKPNDVLLLLARDMLNVSTRLGSLKTTFTQMLFSVTEFQRCYLKTVAILNYLEFYKPCMYGNLPATTTAAKCIGAFTNMPSVAQDLFTAGIPVWFCQPIQSGPFLHNVISIVTPLDFAQILCLEKPDPPFPVIYDGPLNIYEKHNALHKFSQSWLVFKDPFQYTPPATQPPTITTSQPSTSMASQRLHHKYISFFVALFSFSLPV